MFLGKRGGAYTIVYMSWASRRRTTYLSGVILFFVVVIGAPVAYELLSQPATCTDGKQDGGETDVDRGGPCPLLDTRYVQPYAVLWTRSFKVRDGTYTAVASVQNPNPDAGVVDAHYKFSLYDAQNILVAEREGDTFIMPGAVTPVVESRIDTGNRTVTHSYFEFTDTVTWERMSNTATALSVDGKQLSQTDTTPTLSAQAHNISVAPVLNPGFVAVIYDGDGNAFAASETRLDRLNGGASATITFTWPSAFTTAAGRIDIIPVLPPAPAPAAAQQ